MNLGNLFPFTVKGSLLVCAIILLHGIANVSMAQTELAPWGNITGIRIDGQLMEFESSLRVVKENWSKILSTAKERQRPKYDRKGTHQVVTTTLDQLSLTEDVNEKGKGSSVVIAGVLAREETLMEGVFFSLSIPGQYDKDGAIQADEARAMPLSSGLEKLTDYLDRPVRSIRFLSPQRQLQLSLTGSASIRMRREHGRSGDHWQVYIPIHTGTLSKNATAQRTLTIKASGTVDRSPVALRVDPAQPGREFDGFGGNFRLQNPRTDPLVIDYSLANLRVAWARVEMPWRFWQVNKTDNPLDSAKQGRIHPSVRKAMEMAQRLGKMGIPVILSAWSAPAWAVVGTPKFSPGPDGVWGNPLDSANMKEIYRSIGDYVTCLKEQYGVEPSLFSFNESDLGINIRQTAAEHAELIRGLGAYFAERGLKTKMLLGDNSDATTYSFIDAALDDPATHPYIGAISFHSWRGWEKETLQKWADAATKLDRPLLVGEGSIDAQAWGYPAIFEEPTYALAEINLYIRILSICQPAAILQWQLTADYSPLAGGGIFGDSTPLRPTQRFWNLKQLASTPENLRFIPASSDKQDISIAALGNPEKKVYTIHLVNNGPSRTAHLSGLPAGIRSMRIYITDKKRAMKQGKAVPVINGKADFIMESETFTTLVNEPI